MRSFGVSAVVIVSGCSEVLGGLPESTARDAAPSRSESVDASAAAPCDGWLPGFRHRVRVEIVNDGDTALEDHAVRLALDTRAATERGAIRPNGNDLRVARAGSSAVLPSLLQGRLRGAATVLWVRSDLARGPNELFLYYGADDSSVAAPRGDVFFDGIVANAAFDVGSAPWTARPPTRGGEARLAIADRRATVTLTRPIDQGPPSMTGWCQRVTFPPARRYRLVFDAVIAQQRAAFAAIWVGGFEGRTIWSSDDARGAFRAIDSELIEPGTTWLCLGAVVRTNPSEAQVVTVEFGELRVRSYADVEPIAAPAGREETCGQR